ncbi:MAG TPA: SOS response-associated peptidase family protein [Hanamia sp.]|nr:SOS response-associated peptidase family protein [Hanamia sp.]
MCYDISFTVEIKQLSDYFPDLVADEQIEINFDGTHIIGHLYQNHPIIYQNREDKKLHVRMMEWGCVPFYVKDLQTFARQRASMLNARSERILEDTKSYWYKIRNRRCLIPLNGFYEHRKVAGFKNKVPYFITLKEQKMFFLPGLYSVAEIVDKTTGEMIKNWSYTLITRPANSVMKQIHNDGDNKWRMPLLLPFELSQKWVNEELPIEDYKAILDFEMPPAELDYLPVFSIRTSKLRPDNKAKNEYYEWENLPELEIT